MNPIVEKLLYSRPVALMLTGLLTAMFWWAEHIDGVEPKTGQHLYKNKTRDGKLYAKRRGLLNIFNSWKEVKPTFGSMDVLSLYSAVMERHE